MAQSGIEPTTAALSAPRSDRGDKSREGTVPAGYPRPAGDETPPAASCFTLLLGKSGRAVPERSGFPGGSAPGPEGSGGGGLGL